MSEQPKHPDGYNEAGAEWLEPWCDEHPNLDGQRCVACIGASHDAWMHRAKAAEAKNAAWRRGECECGDDHASWCLVYRLEQALLWMEHESSMPDAGALAERLRAA